MTYILRTIDFGTTGFPDEGVKAAVNRVMVG